MRELIVHANIVEDQDDEKIECILILTQKFLCVFDAQSFEQLHEINTPEITLKQQSQFLIIETVKGNFTVFSEWNRKISEYFETPDTDNIKYKVLVEDKLFEMQIFLNEIILRSHGYKNIVFSTLQLKVYCIESKILLFTDSKELEVEPQSNDDAKAIFSVLNFFSFNYKVICKLIRNNRNLVPVSELTEQSNLSEREVIKSQNEGGEVPESFNGRSLNARSQRVNIEIENDDEEEEVVSNKIYPTKQELEKALLQLCYKEIKIEINGFETLIEFEFDNKICTVALYGQETEVTNIKCEYEDKDFALIRIEPLNCQIRLKRKQYLLIMSNYEIIRNAMLYGIL